MWTRTASMCSVSTPKMFFTWMMSAMVVYMPMTRPPTTASLRLLRSRAQALALMKAANLLQQPGGLG